MFNCWLRPVLTSMVGRTRACRASSSDDEDGALSVSGQLWDFSLARAQKQDCLVARVLENWLAGALTERHGEQRAWRS